MGVFHVSSFNALLVSTIRRSRRTMASVNRYPTDPPSAASTGKIALPFSVFDVPRLMSYVRAGMISAIPEQAHPNDALLIATVIELGMPRWSAEQMKYNPALRLHYYMTWLDVREAAKGNKEAQGRIDGIRASFAQMRKDELISDTPNHTIGLWER